MSTITESYAKNMLAAHPRQSDAEVAQIEPLGRGLQMVEPLGAVAVAVRRDTAAILQRLKVMAGAAGQKYFYRFPVTNKDGKKTFIEGPSIDCALAVARNYGNCDVNVRVSDEGDHWIFLARFRDFETGFTLERAFQQRKGQKTMKTDEQRQLDIVFQIGQSKAIRNVICNALADFTDFAFEEARSNLVERVGRELDKYRGKVLERLAELKIDVKRVELSTGRAAKDWLAPDVTRIIGEIQSIGDGMASADDLYPHPASSEPPPPAPKRTDAAVKAQESAPHPTAETAAQGDADDQGRSEDAEAARIEVLLNDWRQSDFWAGAMQELADAKDDAAIKKVVDGTIQDLRALIPETADCEIVIAEWRIAALGFQKALAASKPKKAAR